MLTETKNDLDRLELSFSFIDAAHLFQNEPINDHSKRAILRFFFIQIDNVLKLIGRTKNKLFKEHLLTKAQKDNLEQLTTILSDSYDRAYDTIRDKIAAHNQPLELVSLLNWWNDIDQTTIAVLHDDVKKIQSVIASANGVHFSNINDYAPLAIPPNGRLSLNANSAQPSVFLDRLALTKPNAVSIIACHSSQEKAQIILSIIDFLEIDFALTLVTNNLSTKYAKLLFDTGWLLAVVDICALVDNLFEDNQYDKSLLSYWKDDMAGYTALQSIHQGRNLQIEAELRELRNMMGAHIDSKQQVSNVLTKFEGIDLGMVHQYACALVNAFFDACKQNIRTRIFCVHNVPVKGVVSVPNGNKPFQN